jgi:hypothetical protein
MQVISRNKRSIGSRLGKANVNNKPTQKTITAKLHKGSTIIKSNAKNLPITSKSKDKSTTKLKIEPKNIRITTKNSRSATKIQQTTTSIKRRRLSKIIKN